MYGFRILILTSRGVYNFIGIVLVGWLSFILLLLCILFRKQSQIFVKILPYVLKKFSVDSACEYTAIHKC